MGLKKLSAKVDDYNERLVRGKVSKIKPSHVEKVLAKLRKKSAALQSEVTSTKSADKKARLKRKLGIAKKHIQRAEWLLHEVR